MKNLPTLKEFLTEKTKLTMKKVFLGGTCNESTWRDTLISKMKGVYV